jgi:hypothetical protein
MRHLIQARNTFSRVFRPGEPIAWHVKAATPPSVITVSLASAPAPVNASAPATVPTPAKVMQKVADVVHGKKGKR